MALTAVELLEKKLKTYLSWSYYLEEDFKEAKEMENEQLKEMYLKGIENYDPTFKRK